MKIIILTLLTVCSTICFGQDYLGAQLKTGSWVSDEKFIKGTEGRTIELRKLRTPIDSLKENSTVWTFGQDLTIEHFDKSEAKLKMIASGQYDYDSKNGLLSFSLTDIEPVSKYKATIVSTGAFILLRKVKTKRAKILKFRT